MANPFVAEIRIFPFNFAPKGWAFCNGQILPISQNTTLFSLLGTTYGGDGRSNFALPNLQGNVAIGQGQGPGLSLYELGEAGGSGTVTLQAAEVPQHTHSLNATSGNATTNTPTGNMLATVAAGSGRQVISGKIYSAAAPNTSLAAGAIANAGGGQPHNNLQPYLTLNFCIALQGVYPPRT